MLQRMKRNLTHYYLSEIVNFGGEQMARGEMIKQLYKTAATFNNLK